MQLNILFMHNKITVYPHERLLQKKYLIFANDFLKNSELATVLKQIYFKYWRNKGSENQRNEGR